MLTLKLGRACTIYKGQRGYSQDGGPRPPTEIIYTVVTQLEPARLSKEIVNIDKKTFVIMGVVKDLKGGMIKKKPI